MIGKDVELIEYSKPVDLLNTITHLIGALLSFPALFFLLDKSNGSLEKWSAVIYCFSVFAVYGVSALYHALPNGEIKRKVRIIDHSTIPLMIAGTATPCALISLYNINKIHGIVIFICGWFIYFFGLFSKFFFFEKLKTLTMGIYICGGLIMLISALPVIDQIDAKGFLFLIIGSLIYVLGAIFCGIGAKFEWFHVIFHVTVIIASTVHYYSIFTFVY